MARIKKNRVGVERWPAQQKGARRCIVLCLLFLGEGDEGLLDSSSPVVTQEMSWWVVHTYKQLHMYINIHMTITNSLPLFIMTLTM